MPNQDYCSVVQVLFLDESKFCNSFGNQGLKSLEEEERRDTKSRQIKVQQFGLQVETFLVQEFDHTNKVKVEVPEPLLQLWWKNHLYVMVLLPQAGTAVISVTWESCSNAFFPSAQLFIYVSDKFIRNKVFWLTLLFKWAVFLMIMQTINDHYNTFLY